jgi:hypothetical protein
MASPKADPARCDVPGCGMAAVSSSEGNEKDVQGLGRPAIKNINVCVRHSNWPHSDDAKVFALTDIYRKRVGT